MIPPDMMVRSSVRGTHDGRDGNGVAADESGSMMSSEHVSDPVDELALFTHTIRLQSRDPATNRNRFYSLTWQRDLWGTLTLVQRWGRFQRPGRSRATTYLDRSSAQKAIHRLLRRRLRHGYTVIERR